jgi:hypothetical protein
MCSIKSDLSLTAIFLALIIVSSTTEAVPISPSVEPLHENLKKSSQMPANTIEELLKHSNEIVDKYVKRPLDYGHGSAALALVVSSLVVNKGDILEMGINHYITKTLRKVVKAQPGRILVSLEVKKKSLSALGYYNTSAYHQIYMVTPDEILQYGRDQSWGVVYIDHQPPQLRHKNVNRFATNAQLVIVHDAELEKESKYMLNKYKVSDSYKNKCHYTIYDNTSSPLTTLLLSNFIDFTDIGNILASLKTDYGHSVCINGKC